MQIIISLFAIVLSGCYTVTQGYEQLKLMTNEVPVNDVMKENSPYDKKIKHQLKILAHIKSFANKQGLNSGGAYEDYVHLERDVITYLALAAPQLSLEKKTWWFPIIGSVPYLGFFNKEDRDEELEILRQDGYDVHAGGSAAFSSLGWFEDPIYSPMLRRSHGRLAHLIFHELIHRTIWISDEVKFNENLAEFCASILTETYLKENGLESELTSLALLKNDRNLYKGWLRKLRKKLKSIYKSERPKDEKLKLKKETFQKFVSFEKPKFKKFDFVGSKPWNNARVASASIYSPDYKLFEKSYKNFKGLKIIRYLKALEGKYKTLGSTEKALESLASSNITLQEQP